MQSSHNGLKTQKAILGTIKGPIFSQNKYHLKTKFHPNKDHKRYFTKFGVEKQNIPSRLKLKCIKTGPKWYTAWLQTRKNITINIFSWVCNGETQTF